MCWSNIYSEKISVLVYDTWFKMSEGQFPGQEFPDNQGETEHVSLDAVLGALGEDLWSHPAQVL